MVLKFWITHIVRTRLTLVLIFIFDVLTMIGRQGQFSCTAFELRAKNDYQSFS